MVIIVRNFIVLEISYRFGVLKFWVLIYDVGVKKYFLHLQVLQLKKEFIILKIMIVIKIIKTQSQK